MITLVNLLFIFVSVLVLACMLVLLAISQDRRHKIGYLILLVTFLIWDWFLYALPQGAAVGWLYLMPVIWLVLIFRYSFPVTNVPNFPMQRGEPHETQESLRGPAATREVLTFYFLLLIIGLIILLVFLYTSQLYA